MRENGGTVFSLAKGTTRGILDVTEVAERTNSRYHLFISMAQDKLPSQS
jgi:hypothetical protein